MAIKVMLADDHILMREGIRQLLEFDGSIEVISEANDGEECLDRLQTFKPQVLLLDINMPKKNGIEVLEEIKRDGIDIGVDGFILKDSESAELKRAIVALVNGEKYIQPKLIPALNKRLIAKDVDKDRIASLTNRELEVLIQVANGLFNKEIATTLNISERKLMYQTGRRQPSLPLRMIS